MTGDPLLDSLTSWTFLPLRYSPSFAFALEVVIGSMSRNVDWFMHLFNVSEPSSTILVLNLLPPRAPNSHYLMILAIRCMATVRSTAERVLEHDTMCFHLLHQALAICQQTQIPSFSVRWCYLGMKRGVWSQFPNSLFPINSGIKQGQNKKTVQLSKMGTPF